MVLGVVQRREAHPIGLDLGAFGNIKAHRSEDFLDPLDGARHRVQAADATLAARQADIQRLGLELCVELFSRHRLAPSSECRLDALLGLVDLGAASLLLVVRQRRQAFEQFGDAARLAHEAGFGVLQLGGGGRCGEFGERRAHQLIKIVHVGAETKKGRPRVTTFECVDRCRTKHVGLARQLRQPLRTDAARIKRAGPSPWQRCCRKRPDR